jgi:hypothetical protein
MLRSLCGFRSTVLLSLLFCPGDIVEFTHGSSGCLALSEESTCRGFASQRGMARKVLWVPGPQVARTRDSPGSSFVMRANMR